MYTNAAISGIKVYSLIEMGTAFKVRLHFNLDEFACQDGSDIVLIHNDLLDFAEALRVAIDMPLHMNSAYRTWSHHVEIYKGLGTEAPRGSAHLYGMAGDFVCDDMALLEEKINELNPGGIGLYNTFIHADVKGENRRWDNRK